MSTTTANGQMASAVFGRLFWMMVGPFILGVCAIRITGRTDGWFSPLDGLYFLALGGMLLGRCLEFRSGRPLTAMGTPATAAQLRRNAPVLSLLGITVWILANLIGNRALDLAGCRDRLEQHPMNTAMPSGKIPMTTSATARRQDRPALRKALESASFLVFDATDDGRERDGLRGL